MLVNLRGSFKGIEGTLPHLHRDWPQPHLHCDWPHPCHICTGTCAVPAQEEDPSASGPVAVAPARVAPVSVNGSFGNAGGTDGALRESLLEKGNLSKSGSNRPLITVLHEAIHPSPAWFRKHVCSDVQLAWILGGAGVCLGVTSLALQAYSAAQPPPSSRSFFSWRG